MRFFGPGVGENSAREVREVRCRGILRRPGGERQRDRVVPIPEVRARLFVFDSEHSEDLVPVARCERIGHGVDGWRGGGVDTDHCCRAAEDERVHAARVLGGEPGRDDSAARVAPENRLFEALRIEHSEDVGRDFCGDIRRSIERLRACAVPEWVDRREPE